MIIITSSVPKSASTAIVRLIKEMIAKSGKRSAQDFLDSKRGHSFFKTINFPIFLFFVWLNMNKGIFVIKTHRPPTFYIKLLIRMGLSKAVFSYRDPRDVILSIIDHGNRSRHTPDEDASFKNITDFKSALKSVKRALKKHDQWQNYGNSFFIRYEEFMADKRRIISSLNQYLEFGLSEIKIDEILDLHESEKTTYHNYNKGLINRYLIEMTEEHLIKCNNTFEDYLRKNKYPVTRSNSK